MFPKGRVFFINQNKQHLMLGSPFTKKGYVAEFSLLLANMEDTISE